MKAQLAGLIATQLKPRLADSRAASIVAIGDVDLWRTSCGSIPRYDNLHFCTLEALDRPIIELCRPELVVSPVVTSRFDCIDVANTLSRVGYAGAYRALARNLPNPGMICREVRGYFPTLDFDICEIHVAASPSLN